MLRRSLALVLLALAVLVAIGSADARRDRRPRIWVPSPRTTWQIQFTTPVDRSIKAAMFDIDMFDNSASVVRALHRTGVKVICYVDGGTWENWRTDAHAFPKSVLGKSDGWPGEQWLDIRRLSVLAPIMKARFELCKQKGFNGVDVDNVDGYENDTGFPLTASDQLTYNRWLARTAHSLGLSIGLKNDFDQVRQLEPYFDFAIDEQCFQYSECSALHPFVAAHKAVFEIEYSVPLSHFCRQARADGFMAIRKDMSVDAKRQVCW